MIGSRLSVALALVGMLAISFVAGEASGESRYSLRGFGENALPSRADLRALGSAETAASIPSLNGNPASIGFTDRALFTGSYTSEWIRTEEPVGEGVQVRTEYNGLISNLGLHYPLPRGFTIAAGLLVGRRSGGQIERATETEDGIPYLQEYEEEGNLLRIPVLASYDARWFQIGGGFDLTLVNAEVRWRNTFDPNSGFLSSNDLDKTNLFGGSWRFGARVPFSRFAAVGGWATLPNELHGERTLENDDPSDNSDDLRVGISAEPGRSYAAGIELTPFGSWRILADWTREEWSQTRSSELDEPFRDVDRLAAGLEWSMTMPGGVSLPFRLGYRQENLHFYDARGMEVDEYAATLGSGFGFAGGRGQFDWFLEYGERGEEMQTEYYEQYVRFGVSITGYEEWSRRKRPEAEEDW